MEVGPDDIKWCSKCQSHLPGSAWSPSNRKRKHSWCRKCAQTAQSERRRLGLQETRDGICKLCGLQIEGKPLNARYCARGCTEKAHKMRLWESRIRRAYGVTAEQVDKMKAAQGGVCAICLTEPRQWNIDHCHSTGQVRGLLCTPCNTSIGHFRDDPGIMRRAASYVETSSIEALA